MRVLIIDDEAPARAVLRRRLAAFPEVEVIGEAVNGLEAIEMVERDRPDLLLLDVEMPGLNGFETLAELIDPPAVVFATAYDHYAVRAFEANAVDYLLKPVQPDALERALRRTAERTRRPITPDLLRDLRAALQPDAPAKLAARRGRKIILVPRRDVLYVQSEDRLVFLYTASERLLTARTVTELEASLPASEFLRISRSTLVSLDAVQEMYPWMSSGAWRVRLRNGAELDVSRDRVRELRDRVGL